MAINAMVRLTLRQALGSHNIGFLCYIQAAQSSVVGSSKVTLKEFVHRRVRVINTRVNHTLRKAFGRHNIGLLCYPVAAHSLNVCQPIGPIKVSFTTELQYIGINAVE